MDIDLRQKENQLTLDQFNNLSSLAKDLVTDGSPKTLINSALDYYLKLGYRNLINYCVSTDVLFPRVVETDTKPKYRSLSSKCDYKIALQICSRDFEIIEDRVFCPDEDVVGDSFITKPSVQLGSLVYNLVLDYALNLLVSKDSVPISTADRCIPYDYVTLEFKDSSKINGNAKRRRGNIHLRKGEIPLVESLHYSEYSFVIPQEHETVQLVLNSFDFLCRDRREQMKPLRRPPFYSNSGIVDTNSKGKQNLDEEEEGPER